MQVDLAELNAEPKVIEAIRAFRSGEVEVLPGGGGKYGVVRLAGLAGAEGQKDGQKSLFDF
jgi:PHP family Zn ribbon phosphoesterase